MTATRINAVTVGSRAAVCVTGHVFKAHQHTLQHSLLLRRVQGQRGEEDRKHRRAGVRTGVYGLGALDASDVCVSQMRHCGAPRQHRQQMLREPRPTRQAERPSRVACAPGLLSFREAGAQRDGTSSQADVPVFPSASGLSRGYSGMHSRNSSKMVAAFSLPYCPRMCSGDWPLTKQVGRAGSQVSHSPHAQKM